MRQTFLAGALALLPALPAFAQEPARVVVANYPLQVMMQTILGDTAEVVFPVPEGADPSFWRPSISDISMIQSADLIVLNGAGFSAWVDRVSLPRSRLVNASAGLKDQFIFTQSITHSHGDGGEHSHDGLASYIWLDPTLAALQAEAVASAAIARGLGAPEEINTRLDALRTELGALDAKASEVLSAGKETAIIATHPRYQYFARRYGLSISALEWEAGAMPTAAQFAALQDEIAKTGARILIWEAQPPSEAVATAESLGLASVVFDPLADKDPGREFFAAFDAAVSALAAAIEQTGGD